MRKFAFFVLFAVAASFTACSNGNTGLTDDTAAVPSESSAVDDETSVTEEAIIDAIKEEPVVVERKYDLETPVAGLVPEEETGAIASPKVIAEGPIAAPEEAAGDEATPEELPAQDGETPSGAASATGLPSSQTPTQVSQPTTVQWITQYGASMTAQEYPEYQVNTDITYYKPVEPTPSRSRGVKQIIDCEHTRVGCP